jgi:DNA-binding transcriptional LysR family regulator
LRSAAPKAVKQAVAAGPGVAIVSAAAVCDQVKLGRLKIVPMHGFAIERRLCQVKSPGRIDSPGRRLRADNPAGSKGN